MQTSAHEKEKAGAVIEMLVSENCCDSVDRCYLMRELLKVAELSKPGIGMTTRPFHFIRNSN